jgi:NTE family protein
VRGAWPFARAARFAEVLIRALGAHRPYFPPEHRPRVGGRGTAQVHPAAYGSPPPTTGADAPVAFVFASGGNLGSAQVGMLHALVEHDIHPHRIVGCSVGAINGAAFALDPTFAGVERLEAVWRELDSRDLVARTALRNAVALARRGQALNEHDGLRAIIERVLPVRRFDQLRLPFECMATNLRQATETWFTSGDLVDAVLASSAVPVLFPPVGIDGEWYLDGGILRDVPLTRAVEQGATTVYVLGTGRLAQPWNEPKRPLGMAFQASWIARKHRFHQDLAAVPAHVAVHLLPDGDPPATTRIHDLSHTAAMIDEAYAATSQYLANRPDLADPADDPRSATG